LNGDKCSSVGEMGHNKHWPKRPWVDVYVRTKWHLDPSSSLATTDIDRKLGDCAPLEHSRNVAGAEAYRTMPSFILIHPTVWPQYTNVTDTTDRTTFREHGANRFTNGRPKRRRYRCNRWPHVCRRASKAEEDSS